jgi:hypothetical protein
MPKVGDVVRIREVYSFGTDENFTGKVGVVVYPATCITRKGEEIPASFVWVSEDMAGYFKVTELDVIGNCFAGVR